MAFGFTGRSKACYQGKRQQQTILFPGSYQLQTWVVEPAGEGEWSCMCVCISGQAPRETLYCRSHYLRINGKGVVGMRNEAEGVQGARKDWRKGGAQKQSLVGDSTWTDPER